MVLALARANDNDPHDGLGLTSETFAARPSADAAYDSIDYDALGRRDVLTFHDGSTQTFGYDGADDLTQISHAFPSGQTAASEVIGLGYDAVGEIVTRTSSNPAYDGPAAPSGSMGYGINGLNQVTGAGSLGFSYDLLGNLVSDGVNRYLYDADNHLAAFNASATMRVDPVDRLMEVTDLVGGMATTMSRWFRYHGGALLAEYGMTGPDNGVLYARHVPGPGVDETVVSYAGPGTTARSWLLTDERGSTIAAADSAGAASAIDTYDPYGVPGPGNVGRFQYTGQAWIPQPGLYHYKARDYAPALGRFLQTDPVGYKDSLNLYEYVGDDPIDHSDPTGEFLWPWQKPVTVEGGAKAQQKAVQAAVNKGAKTPRGQALIKQIIGGLLPGNPVIVHINNDSKTGAETPGSHVEIDPRTPRKINTAKGVMPASLARRVWHEIGHAVTGTGDEGPGRMNNVKQNENPIAQSMGEPERTTYSVPQQ